MRLASGFLVTGYCDLGDSDICRLNLPLFIVVLTVFTFIVTSLILIAPLVFILRG